jgi:hypothetical protein
MLKINIKANQSTEKMEIDDIDINVKPLDKESKELDKKARDIEQKWQDDVNKLN